MYFNKVLGMKEFGKDEKVFYRVAIRAIILQGDKILMVKSNTGDYKFPGGGVEKGETPEETLRREVQEETGQEVPVTIKIIPDGHVQLIRAGEMRMRLKFGYKERLETAYKTPYGMILIQTFTNELHVSLKDRPASGNIVIAYDLFMGEEKLGEYHLTLDFTA